jgi:membrane protease YdiL (CAAX protease family)
MYFTPLWRNGAFCCLSGIIYRSAKNIILAAYNVLMKHLERALDHQNQGWKYLLIILAGFLGGQILGAIPLIMVIATKVTQSGMANFTAESLTDLSQYGISSNVSLILMLLPFVTSLIITVLLFKPLHKRTLKEVINGTKHFRWSRFFFSFLLWGGLLLAVFGIEYFRNPSNYTFNFNAAAFIPLVLISVILIPLQTSYEEILFRGYLTQGVAAWTRSRWLAVLIPGVLFGLIHIANPEVSEYGLLLTLPQYILFGIVFGIITILNDGIESTMGAHAVNNLFACLMLTFKASALQTNALFVQHKIDPAHDLILFVIVCIVFVFLLSRKYKWNFPVLNKRVEEPENTNDQLLQSPFQTTDLS